MASHGREGLEVSEAASEGSGESGDPSSPILGLDESWDGVVNGVRTSMSYDPARGAFYGFVENPGNTTLCFVQIELNLKQWHRRRWSSWGRSRLATWPPARACRSSC